MSRSMNTMDQLYSKASFNEEDRRVKYFVANRDAFKVDMLHGPFTVASKSVFSRFDTDRNHKKLESKVTAITNEFFQPGL